MSLELVLEEELKSVSNGIHACYKLDHENDYEQTLDSLIITYCRDRDELCIKEIMSDWILVYDMKEDNIELVGMPVSVMLAKLRYITENTRDKHFTKTWQKLFSL